MVVFSLDEVSNSPAVTVFLWLFFALSFSFYAKDGLKIIVFAFVLLNGVIFPFCVPFYRLKNMYKNLLRMRDEIKSFYEKEEKNLLHEFDKFYSDVMKDMLSNQKK